MKSSKDNSNIQKGERTNFENYRGVSLLNTAYKVYAKIVTKRLANIIENIILEERSGFRRGISCTHNILIITVDW